MSNTTVRNYGDARFWEVVVKHDMIKNKVTVDDIKRELREFYHKPVENPDTDGRTFHEDIDGMIVLKPLPECIETLEEAEEYFNEYERIVYRPTYYDCTGQLFTSWHKIFRKPNGKLWMYHSIGRDI